ncbi:MAG: S9 family peptidase [Cyclobacteriaceae bacterium]
MRYRYFLFVLILPLMLACKKEEKKSKTMQDSKSSPPIAVKKPKQLIAHDHTRTDNYYWLNERENQEVIDYLNAENTYLDEVMAHTKEGQERLFEEMKGRIKQDDSSVPYKLDDFYYYTKYITGGEYPIYCRKKGSLEAEEEILADGNEMGKDYGYFSLYVNASTGHKYIAVITDTIGRRVYSIRFQDTETGVFFPETIENVTGNMTWSANDDYVFYSRQDPNTLRWNQIYRHKLGSEPNEDVLVFQEDDETFGCHVHETKSREFILISSSATVSNEVRYVKSDSPLDPFGLIQARERDLEYSVDHLNGNFYIRTNLEAKNFKLVKASESSPGKANWQDVMSHRDDYYLEGFDLFNDFIALEERNEGLVKINILKNDDQDNHYLNFEEPTYEVSLASNPDPATNLIRYNYSSLTTPNSTIDYDVVSKEKFIKKEQEVLGDFNKEFYKTERVFATAEDGTKIPISLVYHVDKFKADGKNPCLQYAYGSYGISMPAYFSPARVTLLDRGFVYAIAHIRGGEEMGRHWYEDGKLLKKKNTFTDFIACSKFLTANNYTSNDRLFAQGGSAGGLLMGAVSNLAPELYKGMIADVAFVDVVTTMLDETIPLTTGEYDEWGNPNEKQYYEYMLSYSPYDNVEKKAYPNMLLTTGLHDSQVQYWEPAKWIAKLREMKTDNNVLLLYTNMEAGHGGASGRFRRLKEVAMQYAFMFDLMEIEY